jgi:hypothetical protein
MAKLTIKGLARDSINSLLAHAGVKLVRSDRVHEDYLPFRSTLHDAQRSGLPLGDYIDAKYNVPGATEETIERMSGLGAFENHPQRICEIGPGSGRYLAQVKRLTNPQHYEIYETASPWRNYLAKTYGVVGKHTDGKTLAETPSVSIDLLHSHKVFVGLPIFTTLRYFNEISRVVRVGGKVVFDIESENCLDDATMERWLQMWEPYTKSIVPKEWTIAFFARRGFRFDGAFTIPMLPGITEYLVFTRAEERRSL